jgi:hypothetical protein
MECFAKKADTDEFHPLNYQQLKIAQDKDQTILKILKMPKTLYFCKDFHGGGKTASLICFKEKIVILGRLQKHAINWYHTTLCHLVLTKQRRQLVNTFGGQKCKHT